MTKNNKRIGMIAALVVAASVNAMAQGNGLAGINEATSMVSSYFERHKTGVCHRCCRGTYRRCEGVRQVLQW